MKDLSLEKVKLAAENGTLESLAKKVPADKIPVFLGLLIIAGVSYMTITAIKEILLANK